MNNIRNNIILFSLVLLAQVIVLNDIHFKYSLHFFGLPVFIPLLFPMLIILLPIATNHFVSLGYALLIGFILDYFSNTPGLHASSLVLLAYLRPKLLNLFFQQDLKEVGNVVPTIYRMSFGSFIVYVAICIGIHHLFYYILQEWSLRSIGIILYKTIISGILSILLILVIQLVFYKKERPEL